MGRERSEGDLSVSKSPDTKLRLLNIQLEELRDELK